MLSALRKEKLVTFTYAVQPCGGAETESRTYSMSVDVYNKYKKRIAKLKNVAFADEFCANGDIIGKLLAEKDGSVRLANTKDGEAAVVVKNKQTGNINRSFVNDMGTVVHKTMTVTKHGLAPAETQPYHEAWYDENGAARKGIFAIHRFDNNSNRITSIRDEWNVEIPGRQLSRLMKASA